MSYPCSSVCLLSSVIVYHFQRSLKPLGQAEPYFMCQASLGRGNEVCLQHLGHMTGMGPTPINGKKGSHTHIWYKIFSRHETWYVALGTRSYHCLFKFLPLGVVCPWRRATYMYWGNENLFGVRWLPSPHMVNKHVKIISGTKRPMALKSGM